MLTLQYAAIQWARWEKRLDPVCANYTPRCWWESDVVGVTRARFWHEIEVKTSASDFRRDFLKDDFWVGMRKHEILGMLYSGKEPDFEEIAERTCRPVRLIREKWARMRRPNYFWFCVPRVLLPKIMAKIPRYAGILTLEPSTYQSCPSVERPPARLHDGKVDLKFENAISRALAFRYHRLLDKIQRKQWEKEAAAAEDTANV